MEKTLLISSELKNSRKHSSDSLEELARLARTAGAQVFSSMTVRLERFNASTFIGSGKVRELADMVRDSGLDLLIFDEDLTPAQQMNLQAAVSCKVLDRTDLILDIFASRARTREGKLQVELAQLTRALTRLAGRGRHMSQQTGGIGTRGPGERQLEYDRRRIRDRINLLRKEIVSLKRDRETRYKRRFSVPMPQVAIVGYTNAGKSTLLNQLTGGNSGVYCDDMLFATLDPTTRRVKLPSGGFALFTDTVGF
ncbi:MAG: GTPase HflX, partial [bacterium]